MTAKELIERVREILKDNIRKEREMNKKNEPDYPYVNFSEPITGLRIGFKSKSKSNIAQVVYQKFPDGMFKIVELRNFLGIDEIKDKYGFEVYWEYFNSYPVMLKTGVFTVAISLDINDMDSMEVGKFYGQAVFSRNIANMKKCGSRLSQIIKEVKRLNGMSIASVIAERGKVYQEKLPEPVIKTIEI